MTYATLILVVGGAAISSNGEPMFHMIGFTACLLATAGRALKTVLQAILLTNPDEQLDPMSLLLYMSAVSSFLLAFIMLLIEPDAVMVVLGITQSQPHFGYWLAGSGVLAYAVNLTNFLVTKYTSALTLQVLGNCKGVIAAVLSVLLFHNPVTVTSCCGYAITVSGVLLYSESKRRSQLSSLA